MRLRYAPILLGLALALLMALDAWPVRHARAVAAGPAVTLSTAAPASRVLAVATLRDGSTVDLSTTGSARYVGALASIIVTVAPGADGTADCQLSIDGADLAPVITTDRTPAVCWWSVD